tara:strand:- start:1318 stop:1539 length:222 start_codon:yes stop_codon:yes gene_type:complete
MSKGDKPRPLSVSYDEYSRKWDDIFGKKDSTEDQLPLYDGLTEEEVAEAEKRVDVIGQNGNDGLHYDKVDGES